jgi:peptide/nickel transport system substrate-binding protein
VQQPLKVSDTSISFSRRLLLQRAATLLAVPAVLGALEACAPSSPSAGPTAGPRAAAPSPAKPPIVTQGVDPETLDPHFGESGVIGNVLNNVLEPLLHYDRNMNIVPVLAESWEVQPDQVTWRFKLRQSVKFQNGEPFNADAVKFTVERTMDSDLRAKGLNDPFPSRSGIAKVNVIDPFTVDMVLKDPNIVMPVFLTFLYVLEPKYYTTKSFQETALQPVGTGPWRVTDWQKGDHLTLQSYSGYWRGDPGIPEIRFKPVPEKSTRLNMLLAGEADVVGGLLPEDFPTVAGDSKLRISRATGSRRVHLGIPTTISRYHTRAVRRALLQAIDYDGLAKGLLGPMAPQRRNNVLTAGDGWLNTQIPLIQYSPDAARQTLQSAGFAFSDKISIYTPEGRYLKDKELATAIAGNLRAIGLNAEAQVLDWTIYTDRMRSDKGLDDLYLLGLGSRFNGPEDASIVTTDQIWDQTHWIQETENGPKFQALYKELLKTSDEAAQKQMVNELQQLFVDEAVWAPLWLEPAASGVNNRFTWEDSGGGNNLRFWLPGEDPARITA